ncbi:hypothetical protein [Hufsiella ginkgonis]|uniref:UbiA prenyltransferase family protein n=1 Tax=Hufsiella ginkgonis TaxID=2695274 RepID=A0A7K1Y3J0_9SPHI|nr:hypothetical protein [Hufsiella ginkgonis]MXV17609.1 hypothetical protein [Hufsiella ginkgonis]
MRKLFRQSLDFLLFSNLFIALCAVAQALVTYKLLNADPDQYVLGILFCATLALYNFSIIFSKPKNPGKSPFKRARWFFGHYRLMISLTIIVIVSLVPLFFFLSAPSKFLLVFLGVVAIAYNIPLFTLGDRQFCLRNIPGIKLFIIALVWSLSCVVLPVLELESHHIIAISSRDTTLLLAKRFLFIAAIAVPFDIRDLFHDRFNDLKTIPVLFGEKKAYIFCQFLLAAYVVMLFVFNPGFNLNFLGLTLTIIAAGWLIFHAGATKDEYYYFLYLDGILVMQYVLLVLCGLLQPYTW